MLHYVPFTKRKEGQSPFSGDGESALEDLQAIVSVISANYEEEEQSLNLSKKSSVFYRIGRPTSHISVFDKLGTQEDNFVVGTQGSIFTRLSHSTPSQVSTQGSVLTRLSHSIHSRLSKDLKAK